MTSASLERFVSSGGARIYRIPVRAFPELEAYVYLVIADGLSVLIDAGSGYGHCNDDVVAGLAEVGQRYGERAGFASLDRILITHGHIDHFGGLGFVRQRTRAPIGVHELDRRVLDNYEEQLVVTSSNLRRFLAQAGVSAEKLPDLMAMYTMSKALYQSVDVGFTFEASGMRDGPFQFVHVPGHCPGQVVIQIDDILLTADHVLAHTTPHQAPESITRSTGLGHYLESLRRVRALPGVRLALGGHEAAIPDLPARIDTIERLHQERLERVLDLLREPRTVSQVSREMFGSVRGYHVLLALEETGAHVEYLAQRGELGIENLREVAQAEDVPIVYRRIGGGSAQPRATAAPARAAPAERSSPMSDQPTAAASVEVSKPWLKFYDPSVRETVRYPHTSLWRLLELAARTWGDAPATIFFGAQLTWREIKHQSERLAAGLIRMGVAKGDRVGLMLPNCPQFVIAYFGILRAGGVVVSVNPTYTEREVGYMASDSGMTAIVAMDALAPRLLQVRPKTEIRHVIVTGLQAYMPEPVRSGYIQQQKALGQVPDLPADPALVDFGALLEAPERPPLVDIDADNDIASLQYTGGTTGLPKAAMLTHFNLVTNAMQTYEWAREYFVKGGERYLVIIPLFHSYGMTMMNFAATVGASLILLPRFDPQMALAAIRTHRPTFFPGVPTLYAALLNHPDARPEDFSSIRACNSGSAPLPLEVYARFREMTDATISEGFGLSEASPVTHSTPVFAPLKPGSIGIPLPDTEARIVSLDDGQTPLPPGEPGELVIRGPQVMKGYWNRPQETAHTLRDGWLFTGDIATMDADGFFYIVDRKKDMLLVSGNNVYPREVEEVLYTHPGVFEAGVIGMPDAYQGESVVAFVVLRPGAQATADDIRDHCRRSLAPYKVPRRVEFRDSLPKSTVGKVLRRQLREQLQAPAAEAPRPATPPAVSFAPDISVADYFEKVLPKIFETAVRPALPADLAGTEFTLQYTIDLAAGGQTVYGLRVTGGQRLSVVPGGAPQPNLALALSEADWRDAITGRVDLGRGPFDLLANRSRLERAQSLRGRMCLELTKADGALYRSTMIYNGAEQPAVRLMMTLANYAAMQRGELSGQAAFLSGSLKFDGDLGLLMALGSLTQT